MNKALVDLLGVNRNETPSAIVKYQPPYFSDLNNIEAYWRGLKDLAGAN